MKKIFSIVMAGLLPFLGMSAQEKAGKQRLPEAGDWAVGVNVLTLLKAVGGNDLTAVNKFGGSVAPFTEDVSILAKYMLTDKTALRANVGFMFGTDKQREYVQDDRALLDNPLGDDKVVDAQRINRNGMSLNLGMEFRKGSNRVQGVFGAGVLFAFEKTKYKYEYGNAMTDANQQPTIYNWGGSGYANGYRPLEVASDGTFYAGLTGSVGVEWFVAPKISLGAEVNVVAYCQFGSQEYRKSEGYSTALGRVEERTDLTSPGDRGFHLGTESLGGALNMTFYF